MTVRKATYADIPDLMQIFSKARGIMRESGNMNQWNDSYPSEEIIRKDIDGGYCMLLCEQDSILATMAFIPGPDPTYAEIYDGEWTDDNPYYVIHRIAVREPGHKAAEKLMDWAFRYLEEKDKKAAVSIRTGIRIDTHRDNIIMHHILAKLGFTRCGVILLANGDPRDAYLMSSRVMSNIKVENALMAPAGREP